MGPTLQREFTSLRAEKMTQQEKKNLSYGPAGG